MTHVDVGSLTSRRDLPQTPVAKLATANHEGKTQPFAAGQFGISEEYLRRRWKPVLAELLRKRMRLRRSSRRLVDFVVGNPVAKGRAMEHRETHLLFGHDVVGGFGVFDTTN